MRILSSNLCNMVARSVFLLRKTNVLRPIYTKSAVSATVPNQKEDYKKFIPVENNSAYKFLKSRPQYEAMFFDPKSLTTKHKQSGDGVGEIVSRFGSVATKDTDFRNKDFDTELVNSILSQLDKFRDEDLQALLYHSSQPVNLPNPDAPNFERLWKGLDAECMKRAGTWTFNELFAMVDLWFLNKLFRYTDIHWYLVKKMFRKCERLTTAEFIRFLFSLNLVRRIPESINTYELEHCLSKHIDDMNATEAAIAAMAFFKTKTPIHDYALFTKFLEVVISEASTLESVFVAAVAKVGRLSGKGKTASMLYSFQEAFLPEIGRLDLAAAMHVGIIGTRTFIAHEEMLHNVLRKTEANMDHLRLKDMERLLLALTMFDIDCDPFCHKVLEQLKSPSRHAEMNQFARTLPAIVYYISMKEIYPYDLINQVLDPQFLLNHYGRDTQKYQRELLCLDFTVQIECPDYKGNRLTEKIWKNVCRTNMLWLWPESHNKVSAYEHSARTAAQYMRNILGGKEFVFTCNILPQFHSAELVFFMDKDNRPVKIPERFMNLPNHEVKYVPRDDLPEGTTPHAILILGYNSVVRNRTRKLLGQVSLQKRQFAKMGYTVHLVYPEEINFEAQESQQFQKSRTEFFRKIALGE